MLTVFLLVIMAVTVGAHVMWDADLFETVTVCFLAVITGLLIGAI